MLVDEAYYPAASGRIFQRRKQCLTLHAALRHCLASQSAAFKDVFVLDDGIIRANFSWHNSFCDRDAHNLIQLRLILQQALPFKRCRSPEVLKKTTVWPAAHEVVRDLLLKQALSPT
jgi:hypothetical protein